jgi:hypothetical protein
MDTNLIQTLWLWWGTIPSDFKFLLLLPFAVGGTALLSDALLQLLAAQGWRPFSLRVDERATRRSNGASQAAERLDGQQSLVGARRCPPRAAGDCGATAARVTPAR